VASLLLQTSLDLKKKMILLPGGSSPKSLFEKLVESNIIWKNISLMATDDRVVPLTSPYSNTGKIQNKFVSKIEDEYKPSLIKLFSEKNNDIHDDLYKIETLLKLNTPDYAFLGMGADGHIAGIFNKNLSNHYCYDFKNKLEAYRRITISMNVFIKTKNIILYILGKDKKKMLTQILLKKNHNNFIPAKFLLENNLGEKVIICDKETSPNEFSIGESIIYL
jgi:6-phosphogluconolactonase